VFAKTVHILFHWEIPNSGDSEIGAQQFVTRDRTRRSTLSIKMLSQFPCNLRDKTKGGIE